MKDRQWTFLTMEDLEQETEMGDHTEMGMRAFRVGQYAEALPLLLRAARQGSAEAQCRVGNIYQLGLGGVDVREREALKWYYRAANQGYGEATNGLASMVCSISPEAAAVLRRLARQQGFYPVQIVS